ncbi:MAG TPA: MarR family transcriptional regulator [Rhizomicrobium sp.]|jgi:DNA-binding MarR family transcriptional regulator|nr:MarR family transcriptional regulator [Rhizomicrobium sp.]
MAKPFYSADTYSAQRSIGCLLRRLTNLMLPRAEARFADKDLTFTHWVILMCLRDGLADTCADIARHMSYDSGAITRLVDQLEKRGFVARKRSTTDRRVVHLAMTAEGKAVTKALTPSTLNFWNELLEDFSAAEAEKLIELLTRLLNKMEKTPIAQDEAA